MFNSCFMCETLKSSVMVSKHMEEGSKSRCIIEFRITTVENQIPLDNAKPE